MRDKTIAAVAENCSRLSDSELKRFELLTNRRFDLDACERLVYASRDSKNVRMPSPIPDTCTTDKPFLSRDVAGKHCWVHAPSGERTDYIKHYLACKLSDPANTSACFLVPCRAAGADWQPLLRRMQRLATFRKGESPFADGSVVAHDQSLAVYYDPPWAQLDACTVQNSADSLAMCFSGTVSNASAQILLDTGAQGAFCSTHFAQRAGILQKLQPGPPTVAHGVSGPVKIIGEVRIRLSIQGFSAVTTLSVADLGNQWDVILGDPWLRQHKVSLNYGESP